METSILKDTVNFYLISKRIDQAILNSHFYTNNRIEFICDKA